MSDLYFNAGATLTVHRDKGYTKLGDPIAGSGSHTIGPCSPVDTHGHVDYENDGTAKWVGTVQVQAPADSDVQVNDEITLPNGERGRVTEPPTRPVNPFTGWSPFIQFTIATPGYSPTQGG